MGRKKVTLYQKLKILTLFEAGFTYANIRNQPGISNGCIINVAKKAKLKLPLKNRLGQGRKRSTTYKEDRYSLNLMKKNREKTSRQLAVEWTSSNGKSISPRTVRRRLLNAGYKSYTMKKKPYGKPHNHSSRLQFAKNVSEWNFNEWKHVIFSDESHFGGFSTEKNEPSSVV